MISTSLHR